jgi:hypothetical protein
MGPGELLPQLLGGGEDQVTQLVAGLGAGFDRAGPGHPQRPNGLGCPVAAFWHARCLAAEGGQRGSHRVGGVGLAALAAGLAVRPHHLGHLHATGGQVAGQPGAVTAGALHPYLRQLAMRAHPGQRRLIPGRTSRERLGAQHPAHLNQHRGHVHIGVRVHAPRDRQHLLCDPGHNLSFLAIPAARGRGTKPLAGTGGQNTSRTPKVRLLPGHERLGRQLPRPPASPGPAVRRQDTRSAVS